MLYRLFIKHLLNYFDLCLWTGVFNHVNKGHTCIYMYMCNGMVEIIMVQTRIQILVLSIIIFPIPLHLSMMPDQHLKPASERTLKLYFKDQRSFGRRSNELVRSVRSPVPDNSFGNLVEHLTRNSGGPSSNSVWSVNSHPVTMWLHMCIDGIGNFLCTMLVF